MDCDLTPVQLKNAQATKLRVYQILALGQEDADAPLFSANQLADLLLWEERSILFHLSQAIASYSDFGLLIALGQEKFNAWKKRFQKSINDNYILSRQERERS